MVVDQRILTYFVSGSITEWLTSCFRVHHAHTPLVQELKFVRPSGGGRNLGCLKLDLKSFVLTFYFFFSERKNNERH